MKMGQRLEELKALSTKELEVIAKRLEIPPLDASVGDFIHHFNLCVAILNIEIINEGEL